MIWKNKRFGDKIMGIFKKIFQKMGGCIWHKDFVNYKTSINFDWLCLFKVVLFRFRIFLFRSFYLFYLFCLFCLFSLPSLALANIGYNGDVLSTILSGLITLLQSTPARLIFIIAIIGVGYGTLALGKIPKEKAFAVIIGIGIVFSAAYIAQQMGIGS